MPPAWRPGHDLAMTEAEELAHLETSLWRAETRFDRDHMDTVLAEDFVEFGRSGRTYTKETLSFERSGIDAHLNQLHASRVGEGVRLVTYVSEVRDDHGVQRANRSSLWVRAGSSWRLRFHQGTPTE
jgi:hypothetical protein